MYTPQGLPAVYFSVLASSVIIVAARSGLLPPCVIPALGLRFHIPEFLADALLFRRCLRGPRLALDLPLPCGQVAVVLLHNLCSPVIHPHERLHIRVSIPELFGIVDQAKQKADRKRYISTVAP